MITKLNLIRNIGRFDSVSSGANLDLDRLTVIYGENGRGKTTISAILKSLGTNNPSFIEERHRLGSQHPPHVVVTSAVGQHLYQNSAWTVQYDKIIVFDDAFVARNVCSGVEISTDHCKNLHEMIIGAQGVALNEALQQHVKNIEHHNSSIRSLAANIPAAIRGSLTVDQFCQIEKLDDVDNAILEAERKVNAAKSADDIQKHPLFVKVVLPEFDIERLNAILSHGLPDLEAEAALRVRNHIAKCGPNAETWIAEGLPRVSAVAKEAGEGLCPFCAQDLNASTVIQHYQSYFSKEYTSLRDEVADVGTRLNRDFGADVAAGYERGIARINETKIFWNRFEEMPELTFDTAALVRALNVARDAVREQLLTKHSTPFEVFTLNQKSMDLISEYENLRKQHLRITTQLEEINTKLNLIKESVASDDLSSLEADLQKLKHSKTRYQEPHNTNCQNYLNAIEEKQKTEQDRDKAREALDHYQQNIFPQYELAINKYLGKFNAGYRLSSVSSRNTRSGATCNYKVLINEIEVPLSPNSGPSFKNTLSSGDRNTLALAFFFASLEQDAYISTKTVVIDDPMTSLDDHRSLTTRQEIKSLVDRTAQVIILSHEKPFLCGLWESADRINRASILVERDANGSTLAQWNVNADCITEHDRRQKLVAEYLDSQSNSLERNVAVALRYMLEAFIRIAYSRHFPPGSMVGQFVNTCNERLRQGDQILSQDDIDELRAILEYANKFHHDTNPAYETERINDTELVNFARRTLEFTKRP